MTRFAHAHHSFLLLLIPVAVLIALIPVLAYLGGRFEAWVNRVDWRRIDKLILHQVMVVSLVAVAFLFLTYAATAIERLF